LSDGADDKLLPLLAVETAGATMLCSLVGFERIFIGVPWLERGLLADAVGGRLICPAHRHRKEQEREECECSQ